MRKILFILAGLFFCGNMMSQPVLPDRGQLFTDVTVPHIYIKINPDTLNWIYANPSSDREFRAVFVFDNGTVRDTVDTIGFRLRGNTSRFSAKKSFNISFNTFTPGGKFYGVEKLNLNGEHNDPSVIRSKIMWDILRKWNIAAPRANHVAVYINNRYYGLYMNVEHIDEEFAGTYFGNKDGNLYKCLYPADLTYRGSNPDSYKFMSGDHRAYDLKINEEADDYSDLAEMIDILNNSSDADLLCKLDKVFNVYDYLRIMAADIFCGNWDGYNYNKNNFYLYHNTVTGKFEYIPYDVDNTFGIDWFNIDWGVRSIYSWQPGGSEMRPLYDRIMKNPELRKQFTHYAGQLISSVINTDSLIYSIDNRKIMIAPYISDDQYYTRDYGYDYSDFLSSFNSATGGHVKYGLYQYLNTRKRSMTQQFEPGVMNPVIKYIRHRRETGHSVMVTASAEAEAAPFTVRLVYREDGGAVKETAMTIGAGGACYALMEITPGTASVSYQVIATDSQGNSSIRPCDPVVIEPAAIELPLLYINEIMADNSSVIEDEYGFYSDWIEIYNGDSQDINLGTYYLTDETGNPDKWQLPGVIIPSGGFELFWAYGNAAPGDHHAGFKLSKSGEMVALFNADMLLVDSVRFGGQTEDISFGRRSDGVSQWVFFSTPTPGASNSQGAVEDALTVIPNPARGSIVTLSRQVSYRVYSTSGRLVATGTDTDTVDISSFAAGVYIIVTDRREAVRLVVVR